jgi:hypothetical protein
MLVGFGSERKHESLRVMTKVAGIQEYQHSPFAFL